MVKGGFFFVARLFVFHSSQHSPFPSQTGDLWPAATHCSFLKRRFFPSGIWEYSFPCVPVLWGASAEAHLFHGIHHELEAHFDHGFHHGRVFVVAQSRFSLHVLEEIGLAERTTPVLSMCLNRPNSRKKPRGLVGWEHPDSIPLASPRNSYRTFFHMVLHRCPSRAWRRQYFYWAN